MVVRVHQEVCEDLNLAAPYCACEKGGEGPEFIPILEHRPARDRMIVDVVNRAWLIFAPAACHGSPLEG